jgi:hypothetical protein
MYGVDVLGTLIWAAGAGERCAVSEVGGSFIRVYYIGRTRYVNPCISTNSSILVQDDLSFALFSVFRTRWKGECGDIPALHPVLKMADRKVATLLGVHTLRYLILQYVMEL